MHCPKKIKIISIDIDVLDYVGACNKILNLVELRRGYVCAANVHMVMEAVDHPPIRHAIEKSSLVVSDGMPLVWLMRLLGEKAYRVYGPTLMLRLCESCQRLGLKIGLYGGSKECQDRLSARLLMDYPGLQIGYVYSPPFRPLSHEEDEAVVKAINESKINILFVGLGCPKQELWMRAHVDSLKTVQVGVGAAFAFHAGDVAQAPAHMQRLGLEWLYRLIKEPRRLWWRYCLHNPRFLIMAMISVFSRGTDEMRPWIKG